MLSAKEARNRNSIINSLSSWNIAKFNGIMKSITNTSSQGGLSVNLCMDANENKEITEVLKRLGYSTVSHLHGYDNNMNAIYSVSISWY